MIGGRPSATLGARYPDETRPPRNQETEPWLNSRAARHTRTSRRRSPARDPEIAGNFRDTAEGETGHAHGHLDFLRKAGDPATGLPIGPTEKNLRAAVAGETHEYTDMYPGMAKTARSEGFAEIADWFETLAKAEKSHAGKLQAMLSSIT